MFNLLSKNLLIISDLESDSFTKSVLKYLESVNDPKPGRVSRGILPIVQSANLWQNPTLINFNVSFFIILL